MLSEKTLDGLAVIGSSYIKRWLESHYDTLMRTPPAISLMKQDAKTRYAIEAALYGLLAYFSQKWNTDSPLGKLVMQVVIDAPAEISKRLLNGFRKEMLASLEGESEQNKDVEEVLLDLDDEQIKALLRWFVEQFPVLKLDSQDQEVFASIDELSNVAAVTAQKVNQENCMSEEISPEPESERILANGFNRWLDAAHLKADERLQAIRDKKEKKDESND